MAHPMVLAFTATERRQNANEWENVDAGCAQHAFFGVTERTRGEQFPRKIREEEKRRGNLHFLLCDF